MGNLSQYKKSNKNKMLQGKLFNHFNCSKHYYYKAKLFTWTHGRHFVKRI